jgi:hypothetical protein
MMAGNTPSRINATKTNNDGKMRQRKTPSQTYKNANAHSIGRAGLRLAVNVFIYRLILPVGTNR